MKKTKYISLLLAGTLLLSMAGCSNTVEEKKAEENKDGLLEYPTYKASDYVELGKYKNLTVYQDMEKTEVTDDEVLDYMQSMMVPTEVDEAAKKGDTVTIDFDGKVDGQSFDGGTAEDYDLEIGSNSFIEGFEDQLVGVKKGDKKDVKVTFPEGYPASGELELANKDAVFAVTVNAVKRMGEFNDSAVSELTGGEYDTIEKYKPVLKEQMQDSRDNQYDSMLDNLVIQELLETSEFKDSGCEVLKDWYIDMNINAYKDQAEATDKELDVFIEEYSGGQMTNEKDLRDALKDAAAENTKTELLIHAIAEKENIKIDDKYYDEHLDDIVSSAGFNDASDFEKSYSKSVIKNTMLMDKVLDFVEETVTVKPSAEDPDNQVEETSEESAASENDKDSEDKDEDKAKKDDQSKSEKKSENKKSDEKDTKSEK